MNVAYLSTDCVKISFKMLSSAKITFNIFSHSFIVKDFKVLRASSLKFADVLKTAHIIFSAKCAR